MPIEKSAGAVIFRQKGDKRFYLLLHYPSGSRASKDYWDLPKGHIEKEENTLQTAKREIQEETSLREKDIVLIVGFKELIKYFFVKEDKKVLKFVTFYLFKTDNEKINISEEHIGYKWLLYKEALETLKFKNAKEVLKKANNFMKN